MNKEWEDLIPVTMVKKLPREVSDHNPLILLTDTIPLEKQSNFDLNSVG